jgi:hypothetical protein
LLWQIFFTILYSFGFTLRFFFQIFVLGQNFISGKGKSINIENTNRGFVRGREEKLSPCRGMISKTK